MSGGRDRTVQVWDLAARRATAVLEGHGETVASVDATADGARAASGSVDGTVRLWDLRGLASVLVLEGHRAPVSCVRFSADGLVVASAGWDGAARLWDAESGTALGALEGHEANVTAVAVHPAGRQVATGAEDGSIRLFDPRSRRAPRRLAGHAGAVTALAFTADGRFLLSCGRDSSVRAFDLRRGEEVRALPHPGPVLALALSSSAGRLLTAGADGSVRAWRLDWELDAEGAAATPTTALSPEAVRARTMAPAPAPRTATLRDDLKRSAPAPVRAIPKAVGGAARSVPWRKIALGAALAAALGGSLLLWRKPPPRLRLSPYLSRAVPREIDLIDLDRLTPFCKASDYGAHLERLVSGNPESGDVACVAASGQPAVVADVLDHAPLDDAEPMTARRLRRNAASALAPLRGDAATAVCARLSDAREPVRSVAATALGVEPRRGRGRLRARGAGDGLRRRARGGGAGVPAAARPRFRPRARRAGRASSRSCGLPTRRPAAKACRSWRSSPPPSPAPRRRRSSRTRTPRSQRRRRARCRRSRASTGPTSCRATSSPEGQSRRREAAPGPHGS